MLTKVKHQLTVSAKRLFKRTTGYNFFNKEQTFNFLSPYEVHNSVSEKYSLPIVEDVGDHKLLFNKGSVSMNRNTTWVFKHDERACNLLPIGSLSVDHQVLRTDFGYPNPFINDFGGRAAIQDFILPHPRKKLSCRTVIAPWSHYFRKEYYLYLMFVAAKLCRIKQTVPSALIEDAIVAYPLFYSSFEQEYLRLLGFKENQVVDTRLVEVDFDNCILGNLDNWLYPAAQDVMWMRELMFDKMPQANNSKSELIYISRSGRRRVENEDELVKTLMGFGFEIIEDQKRSVEEQFHLYNNAKFIIGPHGASFSNIIWSKKGTNLLELFPQRYVYNFFQYLSSIVGVNYAAYCLGPVSHNQPYRAVSDNLKVSVIDIARYLEQVMVL
ncbi:MAG: glycosyltransferase family 61 protein [Bacteroidetes bacterium]|nr:glycosyltransferase family 61 protein [Bacteroidota bacterium]